MPSLLHFARLFLALGLLIALTIGSMSGSAAPASPEAVRGAAFQTDDNDDDADDADDADDDATNGTPGTGQTAGSGPAYPAGIFAGTCGDLEPNPLHQLTEATLYGDDDDDDDDDQGGQGRLVGTTTAVPVTISDTEISARLDDLLQQPHAVAVFAGSASGDAPLACGEIGGVMFDNDELLFALQEQNGSGTTGIAVLEDEDDDGELDVKIYLGSPGAATAGADQATGGAGEAAGAATGDNATEVPTASDDDAEGGEGDDDSDG